MGHSIKNQDKNKERIIHILLVEDDYNTVLINQMVLEEIGYIVHSAYNSEEAIALIKEYHDMIDVIVADYTLPGMNGIELAKIANRYLDDTPFILYTGKTEFIDKKQIIEAGIAKVVTKPCKMKDLDVIIRNLLNRNGEASS